MSRAISSHAQQLSAYLRKTGLSTREVSEFWGVYLKSGRETRQRMVDSPDLFFRSLRQKKADLSAKELRDGIEAKWQKDMNICFNILSRQESKISAIFCPLQKTEYRAKLLSSLLRVLEKGFEQPGKSC